MWDWHEDPHVEPVDDLFDPLAEWRDTLAEREWDYVYHDGEWEHYEEVDAWDEINEPDYDFDW